MSHLSGASHPCLPNISSCVPPPPPKASPASRALNRMSYFPSSPGRERVRPRAARGGRARGKREATPASFRHPPRPPSTWTGTVSLRGPSPASRSLLPRPSRGSPPPRAAAAAPRHVPLGRPGHSPRGGPRLPGPSGHLGALCGETGRGQGRGRRVPAAAEAATSGKVCGSEGREGWGGAGGTRGPRVVRASGRAGNPGGAEELAGVGWVGKEPWRGGRGEAGPGNGAG